MKKSMIGVVFAASLLLPACGRTTDLPPEVSISERTVQPFVQAVDSEQKGQTIEEFHSIKIDVLAGNIRVIPGDRWSLAYHLSEKESIECLGVIEGTLYVETSFDSKEYFDNTEDWYVTVTIPEGTELEDVELETLSGTVEMQEVSCNAAVLTSTSGTVYTTKCSAREMNLESVSEQITGEELTVEQLDAKTTSGDLSVGGAFGKLELETVSGETNLTGSMSDGGEIKSVSGNITLSVSHPMALQVSSLGEIVRNGQIEKSPVHTEDGCPVKVQSVSGKISISSEN